NIIDLSSPSPVQTLPRHVLFSDLKPDPDIIILDPSVSAPPRLSSEKENHRKQPKSEPSAPHLATVDTVRLGSFFATLERGQWAVYEHEAQLGHIWRRGQTKRASDGSVRRITLCCNHYGEPKATHSDNIDPSDHREGRTIRTNCTAHVNLASVPGGWHATVVDWMHNHPPQVPVGGHIPCRPSEGQRELVSEYAASGNFTCSHLSHILRACFPDHILEPRQVSNLINGARKIANHQVEELGGDIPAV
ncbi:hypothetical protein C8R43DRAFT_863487, partial [Mycena crocata]